MPPTPPVTLLGNAYHRNGDVPFGLSLPDRMLHLYALGQTGTGKSTLLRTMALQDAAAGIGFCLIDPHGDLAEDLRGRIVVPHSYWSLADPDCHLGYNPLTRVSAAHRPLIASGLIDSFRKQWADAWGPRMEHLLRHALLALLDQPHADLRDIMRLFVERDFRQQVVARITDPEVQRFWVTEYPALNYKTAADGVAPIANKLGAFLTHPLVRRALCDPEVPLRFRRIMDESGILIVNLAKGRLGTDMANVVGGLILTSLMNAAFSRHDQPADARRPFMLYVDEFHSFSTSAFADMLSEIRKYGVGLTLAQQHLQQTEEPVFASIMGNVGSILAFRVGVLDAPLISRQFGDLPMADLLNLPNHQVFVQLMVKGRRTRPFSATTWP